MIECAYAWYAMRQGAEIMTADGVRGWCNAAFVRRR